MYRITALQDVTVRVQIQKGPATQADRVFIVNDGAGNIELKKGKSRDVTAVNGIWLNGEYVLIPVSDLPKKEGDVRELLNYLLRVEALTNHA
jgi:hypothetical protein